MNESASESKCCPQECNAKGWDCSAVMDLALMRNPERWPHKQVLPLKKPGFNGYATLVSAFGHFYLFEGKTMYDRLRTDEVTKIYSSGELQDVIDRGWVVD